MIFSKIYSNSKKRVSISKVKNKENKKIAHRIGLSKYTTNQQIKKRTKNNSLNKTRNNKCKTNLFKI